MCHLGGGLQALGLFAQFRHSEAAVLAQRMRPGATDNASPRRALAGLRGLWLLRVVISCAG